MRYRARGNLREFEIWVRVGKDEASPRTIVNFSSTVDKLWRPIPSFSISINKLSCLLHYWKLIVITKGEFLIVQENRKNKNWIIFLLHQSLLDTEVFFRRIVNKTLDANKLYQGSAGERRRKTIESKRGNCRKFFAGVITWFCF